MKKPKEFLKAIAGGTLAAATTITGEAVTGSLNSGQWVTAGAAFVVGFLGVYHTPNLSA